MHPIDAYGPSGALLGIISLAAFALRGWQLERRRRRTLEQYLQAVWADVDEASR